LTTAYGAKAGSGESGEAQEPRSCETRPSSGCRRAIGWRARGLAPRQGGYSCPASFGRSFDSPEPDRFFQCRKNIFVEMVSVTISGKMLVGAGICATLGVACLLLIIRLAGVR
jgi:hypothetical protein